MYRLVLENKHFTIINKIYLNLSKLNINIYKLKILLNHLVQLAKDNDIQYKLDIYPYYGSDASAAMRAGAEVRHALLGAGIESSHSYERTHIDSVEATQNLVDAYLQSELIS